MEPSPQPSPAPPLSLAGPAFPEPPPADPRAAEQTSHHANEKIRARSGALLLAASSVFHLLSIPVVLILIKALVENMAGRPVTWRDLFGPPIIWFGFFLQIVLAAGSMLGASLLWERPSRAAYAMIALGAVGVLLSIALYGAFGFLGIFGGVLAIIGGMTARPKRPPAALRQLPPPLPRSSPPAGPPDTR